MSAAGQLSLFIVAALSAAVLSAGTAWLVGYHFDSGWRHAFLGDQPVVRKNRRWMLWMSVGFFTIFELLAAVLVQFLP